MAPMTNHRSFNQGLSLTVGLFTILNEAQEMRGQRVGLADALFGVNADDPLNTIEKVLWAKGFGDVVVYAGNVQA